MTGIALHRIPPGLVTAIVLGVGAAWASGAQAQPPPSTTPDTLAAEARALGDAIPALMDRFGVPGLDVLVVRAGTVVWSASFGMADPAREERLAPSAVFRVESLSKPVTAWGVMRLVEEGVLRLDDPVQRHLRSWTPPPDTPPLTVEQLLSHTAGVGLGDFTARFPPEGPVPSLPASLSREFARPAPPGDGFRYSDTGYNLLQLLVEDVTGEPFDAYMRRTVLDPLGMTDATYRWSPELAARIPVGHDLRGEPVPPYVYPGVGSGGLLATAADLGRFLAASAARGGDAGGVLSDASIRRLHTPVAPVGGAYGVVADGYGLGHFTETLPDGRRAVWHGGQGYGWMTHFHLVPESGDGIVLLANSQRAWPLFAHVLRDWSALVGIAPVEMARLTWAAPLAWALTLLLAVGAGLVAFGRPRRLGGLLRSPGGRLLAGAVGLGLLALVAWAATREYLMLDSVAPGVTGWLGAAAAVLGLALVGRGAGLRVPGRAPWLAAALAALAPNLLAAQEPLVRVSLTSLPSSTVARARSGPFQEASVTMARASLVLPFVHRSPEALVAARLSGSRVRIDPRPLDPAQPLWSEALYDLDLQLVVGRRVAEGWWLDLVVAPGLASDLRGFDAGHLTVQGSALLGRTVAEGRSWGVGASVTNAFGETRVVPLLSLDWRFGRARARVLAPARGVLSWRATERVTVGLAASVDGNVYTLGRSGLLEGGLLRYSVVEVGPEVRVRLVGALHLEAAGGVSLARRLEAEDAGGTPTEDAALRRGATLSVGLALLAPGPGP